MISLEKINAKNIWEILKLKVKESQSKYVVSNCESIIDAYTTVDTACIVTPFAVVKDQEYIGFIMISYHHSAYEALYDIKAPEIMNHNYLIWRFMIDEKYQNKGYGREVIKQALAFIKSYPCGKADYCILTYHPSNLVAKKLYQSLGFKETGESFFHESIAILKL